MQRRTLAHLLAVVAVLASLASVGSVRAGYERPGRTERVSIASDGSQCCELLAGTPLGDVTLGHAISGNGRYVAFSSSADDLVPSDRNLASDVFVHDRQTGNTTIVSRPPSGLQVPEATSFGPSISANGRYVAFSSGAPNLVSDDTNLARDAFVHDRKTRRIERVSVASDGSQTSEGVIGHDSFAPFISADGRYVSFASAAGDLAPGDGDETDVFLHDRKTGRTQLISKGRGGGGANGSSIGAALSAHGRHVVFNSEASNLVAGDVNDARDVFVFDRVTKKMELVSVATDGSQTEDCSLPCPFSLLAQRNGGYSILRFRSASNSISADGRYVLFDATASNLVPTDSGTGPQGSSGGSGGDVFVRDRKTDRTERISVSSTGAEGNDFPTWGGGISANGRFVTFGTNSSFAADDPPNERAPVTNDDLDGKSEYDLYVHDRASGATILVSRSSKGAPAADCGEATSQKVTSSDMSRDGRFIVFNSCSPNLVAEDTNSAWDIFVRDFRGALGIPGTVQTRSVGEPGRLSPSQSWIDVLKDSDRDVDAVARAQGAEILGARVVYRPLLGDLYVRVDVDRLPGPRGTPTDARLAGDPRVIYGLRFRVAGTPYELRIAKLHGRTAPARPAFGLFRCNDGCVEVIGLEGGYGTVGEAVVAAIPLEALRANGGGSITRLRAFSAYGTYFAGAAHILDEVSDR